MCVCVHACVSGGCVLFILLSVYVCIRASYLHVHVQSLYANEANVREHGLLGV